MGGKGSKGIVKLEKARPGVKASKTVISKTHRGVSPEEKGCERRVVR